MTILGRTTVAALCAAATTALTLTAVPAAGEPAALRSARAAASADPIVIAHRGASGHRPEHTLAAYRLAIAQGADYVEPDLVSTKDGVLVARHENEISGTTDVSEHAEFADRETTRTIDGRAITGWFTEDFTLAELKTLRAKERLPQVRPGNTRYDGRFEVPTLDEVLTLVRAESKRLHRTIGVYPETKHPTYFDSIGLSLEEPLVAALRRHHLDRPNAAVFIQSFETGNLRDLDMMTALPLVQLADASGAPYDLAAAGDPRTYRDLMTADGLAEIATYADGVGANKNLVMTADGTVTPVVDDAHVSGLIVHIWTLRDENQFMAPRFRIGTDPNAKGDIRAEIQAFLDAGVDGFFADYPDSGVDARDDWLAAGARQAG